MAWQLGLNRPHLYLWRRWLIQWLVFVALLVLLGWSRGPRPDEVLWVLLVPPLVVLAGWGLVSLVLIGLWTLRNPDRLRSGLVDVERLRAPLLRWRIPRQPTLTRNRADVGAHAP